MKTLHNSDQLQADPEASNPAAETQEARRATGVAAAGGSVPAIEVVSTPDPEVTEKIKRRTFTAAYKLRILKQAESCRQSGEMGALLRREGLYASHLTTWRRQRDQGVLNGLNPRKRGRKPKPEDPSARRAAQLEKENQRLKNKLRKAEIIIEAQKKISELLNIDQNQEDDK